MTSSCGDKYSGEFGVSGLYLTCHGGWTAQPSMLTLGGRRSATNTSYSSPPYHSKRALRVDFSITPEAGLLSLHHL